MFRNYLRVALRSMRRQQVYAIINIVGPAVGLTSAILIMSYVRYEFSYESFIPDASNIFRAVQKQEGNVFLGSDEFVVTPVPLSDAIQAEIPEVETSTVFRSNSSMLGLDDIFVFENGLEANEHFFEVFGYDLERGKSGTVLEEPGTIVLSRNLADRLFGAEDPLGRVIKFGDSGDFTVTGVFTDLPKNSHLQFEFVASALGNPKLRSHTAPRVDYREGGWD